MSLAKNVTVVDYGLCNLDSMVRALEACDARVQIAVSPRDIEGATRLILPGVGAFPDAMANLRAMQIIEPLRERVLEKKIPFLGVCLGMQLLATTGEEIETTAGLNFLAGQVRRLKSEAGERIPHIGWNEVNFVTDSSLARELENGRDFYFVHSFYFMPENPAHTLARTPYCGGFASVVGSENVWGAQFHPEKSQKAGFQLLRNFLAL